MKNSNFHIIFHIATVTPNLFDIIATFRNAFKTYNEVFSHNFDMDNPSLSTFLGMFQGVLPNI